MNDDAFWMTKAYELALKAKEQGEVPVGAVLVDADNNLLGCGWNQVLRTHDPCAHAELIALREAALNLKNYRLLNTTLYATLEPCSMCAGAMVHARIKRVVYAARDFKAGAAGSVYNLLQGYPLNHQVQIDEGIMQRDCAALLEDFFKKRR
ncbi:tRNA adenosine(34) deaminase TadA [Legionella jordanis]|uniref:tRNA-specific adenosine deaminase n=1 Tax=Legionella jordanis TaxID=456 RepID=A0A0W0VA46_9GAMM|nr:tRNA adenosine(34) deaminase TadA [Legionella jordanis]KTD17006.1 tRNA-specific adenosine deaminase [Legionella jordanis]RMX03146.1 tRNA adenosine(34) deaminase TadA [Legionella jordanis]RMX18715.1 tRNA adenosine(34) deaminase TadA [Legionella jordanis]VEH12798.1 tRNA-specific adenosine deaminase [Legionella jordanis]HAT8713057.1 tRNA adenosine(34) deaminase TadA [Legionella jordanis]